MKQKNTGRVTQETIMAAANETGIDPSYLRALLSLAWRGYEVIEPDTVLAWFTPFRCLTLSKEGDGAISAWTVGTMEVSGKVTWFAIYLGDVPAATNVASTMTRAKVRIPGMATG